MTANEIEEMPATLGFNYVTFRSVISATLRDALENGDAIADMKSLRGDFYRALSHALDECDSPKGTLEKITQ